MTTIDAAAPHAAPPEPADLPRPRSDDELHAFVRDTFGLTVPRRPIVAGNAAPFDYLAHAFFEDRCADDLVVWANRGGGKTMLGAVATMLDLLFKPGIQIRILGGSLEQSSRMHEHLLALAAKEAVAPCLAGRPTRRRLALTNGSACEVLAQSHTSVRGVRVQKLRCDEVELFGRPIWQAAQLVTRSVRLGGSVVRGRIEALSTMHEPGGLMAALVDRPGTRVLRWSALDVAERCPADRPCDGCDLWADCGGRAKSADGFVPIDDLVRQRRRTSDATWQSEMLCRRPRREHLVYPGFDPEPGGRHVGTVDLAAPAPDARWLGGIDFGYHSPFVFLWARFWPGRFPAGADAGDPRLGLLEVVDERVERGSTLDVNLDAVAARGLPAPEWVGVDPAGGARNGQTGASDIACLRRRGYTVRTRRSLIRYGLDLVRRRLDQGTLRIDSRCRRLIESLQQYRYAADRPDGEEPLKDGPDHACDALRYLVLNLERGGGSVDARRYA